MDNKTLAKRITVDINRLSRKYTEELKGKVIVIGREYRVGYITKVSIMDMNSMTPSCFFECYDVDNHAISYNFLREIEEVQIFDSAEEAKLYNELQGL